MWAVAVEGHALSPHRIYAVSTSSGSKCHQAMLDYAVLEELVDVVETFGSAHPFRARQAPPGVGTALWMGGAPIEHDGPTGQRAYLRFLEPVARHVRPSIL